MKPLKHSITSSILLMLVCLSITACSSSLIDAIYANLTNVKSSERYTAAIVIAELPIDEAYLLNLSQNIENESEPFKCLLLVYILAKRTQEQRHIDSFVSLYPRGDDQKKIWNLQTETGYPMEVVSPLQNFLVELAKTDDRSLKKLASGLPYADGVHAESLIDQLVELYFHQQDRVLKALAAWPEEIELIKTFANEKECSE